MQLPVDLDRTVAVWTERYGIEATPKCVLIDAGGMVRGSWLGWGEETAEEIVAELKRATEKHN